MCDICHEGGQVLGPYLKPMTPPHAHRVPAGRPHRRCDVREVLRDSMFAATVTGSPVENACRLIKQYEPEGRGYYAAVLALIGRDDDGGADARRARSCCVRPTSSLDGDLRVTAGATLVRDSTADVRGRRDARQGGRHPHARSAWCDAAPEPVGRRRRPRPRRRTCWSRSARATSGSAGSGSTDQSRRAPVARAGGQARRRARRRGRLRQRCCRTCFGVLGMTSEHRSATTTMRPGDFDGADLVVVGPGPGDPRDLDDAKIAAVRRPSTHLLEPRQPFLAVCLGHQVLCGALGLDLGYKDIVFQGTQTRALRSSGRAGDGRLLQHVRRQASGRGCGRLRLVPRHRRRERRIRAAAAARRAGPPRRRRPAHRRHPSPRRGALPRHPVPCRVDPVRGRLRTDPDPRHLPASPPRRPVELGRITCRRGLKFWLA